VAVAGLKHAVAQAIKKKKSRQQKDTHEMCLVASHEREKKILTLQMRCVAFPFAFLRQEIATHERGVRLGFQPLLSLKGDAQAFKNAVCVWNLSGAKFGHTEVWQRMARHFRLPSK